jgi:hypothetical protein
VAEGAILNQGKAPQQKRNLRQRHPFLFWTSLILLVVVIAGLAATEILRHRAEPILKARIIETLSTRFRSRVVLERFHISTLKGMQVEGDGLKLYPYLMDSSKPLFAIDHFSFRTSWRNLLHTPMRVGHVSVKGLSIYLPPKEQRKNVPIISGKQGHIRVYVDEIDCNDASLVIGTNKPGKVPLDFEIGALRLRSVGPGQPMQFDATLKNPKPIGDIHSVGQFGPWNADSPGDSPVRGKYNFSNADLGSIKGIGGILSSTGEYTGELDNIVVDGETDTPDFHVKTGQAVPLHTNFHAIVDGTSGDTYLQPVDATLLHSHIRAKGKVVRVPEVKGHQIALDVVVDHAHIDDLLRVGVKTEPPIMIGAVLLKTKFDLLPGEKDVADRLRLQGNFFVSRAHFTNDKVQSKVDELSMRSQGRVQEAKDNIPDNVKSDMRGVFTLDNGKLTITGLKYDVPGANINMQGTYSLDGNEFDFHGRARLQATVSQLVGGWKGALLKPVDPFFKKNGAGTDVPIKVTGTKSEPHFGLDFRHKDTDDAAPDLKNKAKDSAPVNAPQ